MSRPTARQSSQEILYQGLASSAKITRSTHALIQKELAAMEMELSRPGTIPARRMELLRCICELGAELSRQTESIAKLITSKPAPGEDGTPAPMPSSADVLAEIIQGKRSGRGKL
jgi:hypothetical protein